MVPEAASARGGLIPAPDAPYSVFYIILSWGTVFTQLGNFDEICCFPLYKSTVKQIFE
jgi:hypothetical protein